VDAAGVNHAALMLDAEGFVATAAMHRVKNYNAVGDGGGSVSTVASFPEQLDSLINSHLSTPVSRWLLV
jgi:hypothetical protein